MKIKGKLIIALSLAVVGVVVLSLSTQLSMRSNILIAESVRGQKLKTVLTVEKIASKGKSVVSGISSAVNTASEEGLTQAEQFKSEILALLADLADLSSSPAVEEQIKKLPEALTQVFDAGQLLVAAVIDQEFAQIPEATQLFKNQSQALGVVIDTAQKAAVADLEASLGKMVKMSLREARVSFWIASALVTMMIGLMFFVVWSVIRPMGRVIDSLENVAQGQGDLTKRIADDRSDEIGELAHWFNVFVEKLHRIIRNITGSAEILQFSSQTLTNLSGGMTLDVEKVVKNAGAVKTDSDTISSLINSVASAMKQTVTNIDLIASSAEEMSSTFNDIAQNTAKARSISDGAVSQAQETSNRISHLGDAVLNIGKVTETISEISDQTNLLALNATIEAARAGEAGKGFAVVANEIKELANQTAEATRQISEQIMGIQQSAEGSVEQMQAICHVITDVDQVVDNIAASIEEQSSATKEIAGSVVRASSGINEVNDAMAGCADGAARVFDEVSGIHHATAELAHRSSQVNLCAEDLAVIAKNVEERVGQFELKPAKFNMGEVKGAHLNWRYKLHALINGHAALRAEEVTGHHECDFGRWIASVADKPIAQEAAFPKVCRAHEEIHRIAGDIVAAKNSGDGKNQRQLLETFETARSYFFETLNELYR